MDVAESILKRRTHKKFTGEPVTREQIEHLLELAIWAPNHKLTEPWRFYVLSHERIGDLVDAVDNSIAPDDPPPVHKKGEKLAKLLPKLGAYIAVARTPLLDDPHIDKEDYAACCCAVQNISLGATALGLGSFWSTGVLFQRQPVRNLLGLAAEMEIVASLWLGVPAEEATSRREPFESRTVWL